MKKEEIIAKWESLEKNYHEIICSNLNKYVATTKVSIREMIFSSRLICCNDGIFIIREAKKNNSNLIIPINFNGNAQEARKKFNLNNQEHGKFSNKVEFFSLDYFDLSHCDKYDIKAVAEDDFNILTSDNRILDDKYIRSVADAIELGVNQDFERGQFIFRGQVNDKWELIPKLFRDYPKESHQNEAELIEGALWETLLFGLKSPYINTYDPIELLMNLQHFRVPTRLLDWTSDILIALFFGCYDENDEFSQEDGNFFIIERSQYSAFKINSSENKVFSQSINENTLDIFKNRYNIDNIHIFEPVIKNPRLRVQDGCFMFFPFLSFSLSENKYITLRDYMRENNKYVEQENIKKEEKLSKLWIGNKKIDKNFKKSILEELNEKYGISKKTVFVEIPHIEEVSQYYLQLYEKAKEKMVWIKSQRKE